MAKQSVVVTVDDFARLMRRSYRGLTPKRVIARGEIAYDLFFSDDVSVRIFTSIGDGQSTSAGVGQDAIRVNLYYPKLNRPALTGKFKIIQRVSSWRENLKKRVDELLEEYSEREAYFEAKATGKAPTLEAESQAPPVKQPSVAKPEPPPDPLAGRDNEPIEGTFARGPNGDWVAQINSGRPHPGAKALLIRKSGQRSWITLSAKVGVTRYGELWSFESDRRRYASDDNDDSSLEDILKEEERLEFTSSLDEDLSLVDR